MRAEIRVLGEDKAANRFRAMAGRAERPDGFFRAAARILMRAASQRFGASAWAPLDAETIRQKARKGQDLRIMRATGMVERALTLWGAPGQRLDFDDDSLLFGLQPTGAAYYGRFHQAGEGVPKRKVLEVDGYTRRSLRKAWQNFVMGRRV